MQLIVDANPVISLLIKPGKTLELMFLEELELFAPTLLFKEIEQNKDMIIKKSGLTREDIDDFLDIIMQRIRIIPEEEFIKNRDEAERICPDEKDITYFALALHLKCPVWSNEKKLKEQNKVVVHSTHELIKMFGL